MTGLAERLMSLQATASPEDQVFMFCGSKVEITNGPLRYLVMQGLDPVPLFDPEAPIEISNEGFLGEPYEPVAATETVEEDSFMYTDFYEEEMVNNPGSEPGSGEVADEEPDS